MPLNDDKVCEPAFVHCLSHIVNQVALTAGICVILAPCPWCTLLSTCNVTSRQCFYVLLGNFGSCSPSQALMTLARFNISQAPNKLSQPPGVTNYHQLNPIKSSTMEYRSRQSERSYHWPYAHYYSVRQ